MLIRGSKAVYTQICDTSHIITTQNVFIPLSLSLSSISFPLLSGGEPLPVHSRLPRSLPTNVRAALARAVADTGPEGRLRERHNSLRPEEGHRL